MTDTRATLAPAHTEWTAHLRRLSRVRPPYWARRVLQILPVVLLVVTVNFFLLRLAPGDMADVMAGESGAYSIEYVEHLRERFGLDKPLVTQYVSYLQNIAVLDLGWSHRNGESVLNLILQRLPATTLLVVVSLTLAMILGSALGAIAALTKSRAVDVVISSISIIGFATPIYWLGLMLVVLFSVYLKWLPSSGMYTIGGDLGGWSGFIDLASHLALPAACLTTYYLSIYTRLMRSVVSEIKDQDFVRTAHAKGASPARTVFRHIIPNALLSMITLTGIQFGTLFSGSITIEAVFGWPGLGQLALTAVTSRDFNLLLGILFISSIFVLIVNVVTDLSYALFDPRVELSK